MLQGSTLKSDFRAALLEMNKDMVDGMRTLFPDDDEVGALHVSNVIEFRDATIEFLLNKLDLEKVRHMNLDNTARVLNRHLQHILLIATRL